MSTLPVRPQSPESTQSRMEQLYLLMAKQVQSYQRHHHMGSSSSVPVPLAQELMASITYTIGLAGELFSARDPEESLRLGQEILEERLAKAKSMLELVSATAPRWQTDCRWEALRYLRQYLQRYDPLHMAHIGPDALFYPVLISPPEGIQGIDSCLFYLNILWLENQIMAGVPEDALDRLWDRLPADALNPCEHLLLNGMGKAMLGEGIESPVFEAEEKVRLAAVLAKATEEDLRKAAGSLCQWLKIRDENAVKYVGAVIPQLAQWIGDSGRGGDSGRLFL